MDKSTFTCLGPVFPSSRGVPSSTGERGWRGLWSWEGLLRWQGARSWLTQPGSGWYAVGAWQGLGPADLASRPCCWKGL